MLYSAPIRDFHGWLLQFYQCLWGPSDRALSIGRDKNGDAGPVDGNFARRHYGPDPIYI